MAAETRVGVYRSLEVEAVGEDEFVNKMLWQGEKNFPLRSAYGGQVVGQALMAACHTITDPELLLISAHCYFLSPVKTNERVTYRITCTKDGRFFSSRSVQALQGGKVVSHTLASFKRLETNPHCLSHSPPGIPPGIFPPDDPQQDQEQLYFNNRLELSTSPINAYYCFRKIDQEKLLAREPLPPKMLFWMKAHGEFPEPCSLNEHRVVLAFLSDFSMIYPLSLKYPEVKVGLMTSLDHSIWFHGPVYCGDTWFLMNVRCVQAGESTTLNSGLMYSEDGTLVATCQQQGLYRLNSKL